MIAPPSSVLTVPAPTLESELCGASQGYVVNITATADVGERVAARKVAASLQGVVPSPLPRPWWCGVAAIWV
jgi:hypothetical protein